MSDAVDEIRTRPEESHVISQVATWRFLHHVIRTDSRIALQERQKAKQQTWRCDEIKCPTPAQVSTDEPADYIPEGAPNRNRRIKNRHDATAYFDPEEIGQDCRCRRSVAAFADPHEDSSRKQNGECRCQTGAAAGQAPQNHSRTNNDPAGDSIGEQAENRRADHVRDKKRVAQPAGPHHRIRIVRRKKRGANIGLKRGENLPVDVIEKIDRQEQSKGHIRARQRFSAASFHEQLPIAVWRAPIVNHKPCGPNPLPNAFSISSADHWCAAFIASLRLVWRTYRLAVFFLCRIISAGWTRSSCSSPAHGRFVTSSTRSIITNGFCIRSCALSAVFRSATGIRMLQCAPLRNESPPERSYVYFLRASWKEGEHYCVCSADMKSLRATPRPRSCRFG